MARGRFAPNAFQHNGRVALALVPSLIVLGGIGGRLVVGMLLVGAMVTYIMDALRLREAAFASVWFTLVVANIGFLTGIRGLMKGRSAALTVGIIGMMGVTLMLHGIWATVQFKWIQMRYPMVVLAMERLLLSSSLVLGLVVQGFGAAGAVGIDTAPFYMAALGCVLYALCMLPLPSSFEKKGAGRVGGSSGTAAAQVQDQVDGFLCAAVVVVLPATIYFVTHLELMLLWEHIWSVALLWSFPLLFVAGTPGGLWWVSLERHTRGMVRVLCLFLGGVVGIAAFEGRVIFHAFSQYILLSPPWSWIVVSVFLYLKAGIACAHIAGILDSQTSFILGGGSLVVAAAAGSLAVGLPMALMPAPLISAAGLALYYDSRQLRDYLIFLAGTVASAAWVIWHHFWFLDMHVGGMPMHMICQLLMAALVVALFVPGVVMSGVSDRLVRMGLEAFLLVQAGVICLLEERLFAGQHDENDDLYPAYLVVGTSVLGILMSQRLLSVSHIGDVTAWGLFSIYVAKLPMLVLPEASLVLPSLGLALAISPPLLLFKPEAGDRTGRSKMETWQAFSLVLAITVAVLYARFAIFDVIQVVLSAHPPEGLLLGSLLLAVALGCLPLVVVHYPNSASARRAVYMLAAAGLMLCFLRPPLPIKGGSKCPDLPFGFCPRLWDDRHVPGHEMDDVEIYGTGLARREHWPLWLLLVAALAGLAAVTSGVPVHKSVLTRLGYGGIGGVCVGTYIAMEFFPVQLPLQILILASALLATCFLVLLQKPTTSSSSWMPMLAVAWVALFPATLLLQAESPLPKLPAEMRRLFPDTTSRQVDSERREAGRAALLAIYAAQSLLLAFALKLKGSAAMRSNAGSLPATGRDAGRFNGYPYGGAAAWRAMCSPGGFSALFASMVSPKVVDSLGRMMKMDGAAGLMLQRLSAEGLGWVPTAGNLATLLAFTLCLLLKPHFAPDKDEVVVLLAPVLLLLQQDPFFFRGLTDRRRYFPPALALSGILYASSAWQIFQIGVLHPDSMLMPGVRPGLFVLRNACLALLAAPTQASFIRYLWDRRPQSDTMLFVFAPMNLVPLLMADLATVKVLAGMGIAGAAVQFFSLRHVQHMGARLI